jgi:hypothetical protein
MSNMVSENFGVDPTTAAFGLLMEIKIAGGGTTPVDSVTGKRLSRMQMESSKDSGTVNKPVKGVVTS